MATGNRDSEEKRELPEGSEAAADMGPAGEPGDILADGFPEEAFPEETDSVGTESGDETVMEADSADGDPQEDEGLPKTIAAAIFEWVEIFTFSLAAIILVFTFIGRHAVVDGDSMLKTLSNGDKLVISNLFYEPKQGDIVVFQVIPPREKNEPLIKRVIATEGQVVDIDFKNWKVTVDGVALDEDYANYIEGEYMKSGDMPWQFPLTVEKGKVFVMGDNRNNSLDSRYSEIGQVDVKLIMGKVLIRFFPFNKFGTVKADAG